MGRSRCPHGFYHGAVLEDDSNDAQLVKMSGDLMKVRRLFRRLSDKAPVDRFKEMMSEVKGMVDEMRSQVEKQSSSHTARSAS